MKPDSKHCACTHWPRQLMCHPPDGVMTSGVASDQMHAVAAFNRAGGNIAPPSAAERLKALQPQQQEATREARVRRQAVSLAVRSSDGHPDHHDALAVLFADLQRAEDTRRHLDELAAHLMAEKKAEETRAKTCVPNHGQLSSPCINCGIHSATTDRECKVGVSHG